MSGELTSSDGIVALAATAIALAALVLALVCALRLRALRAAQKAVLGTVGERDLVDHAQSIERGFVDLRERVEETFATIERRLVEHAERLDRSVSHTAVIRYDAYGEMSGRQSSSMALLDEHGTGVVLSSILHRDQARLYVKAVERGQSELELSPEENQAIATALGTGAPASQPS